MAREHRWFFDLVFALLVTCLVVVAVTAGLSGWGRAALVVPFVTFLPGYALLAAIFPSIGTHDAHAFDENESGLENPMPTKAGLDGVERFAFSVVASVAVVPAVALVASFTPWGVTVEPILFGVAGLTVLWTLVALVRRLRLSPERRYVPSPGRFASAMLYSSRSGAAWGRDPGASVFNLLLVVSVAIFATSLAFAAVNPPQEPTSTFTEFYVESNNVTGDSQTMYPARFETGESRTVPVGIANREHEAVDYRLVVLLQRTDGAGANATVVEERELDRRTVSLAHGERRIVPVSVSPTMTGTDLRLVLLLYADEPPDDPSPATAYHALRLPIDVGDGAASGA